MNQHLAGTLICTAFDAAFSFIKSYSFTQSFDFRSGHDADLSMTGHIRSHEGIKSLTDAYYNQQPIDLRINGIAYSCRIVSLSIDSEYGDFSRVLGIDCKLFVVLPAKLHPVTVWRRKKGLS